jgi:hypothetical protein
MLNDRGPVPDGTMASAAILAVPGQTAPIRLPPRQPTGNERYFVATMERQGTPRPGERPTPRPTVPVLTCLPAPRQFLLRPQFLTRV